MVLVGKDEIMARLDVLPKTFLVALRKPTKTE
jgi:hypothetical protein